MTIQDIHPLKALTLVGESARRHGSRLVADCPACEREADIVDEAFVCSNGGCRWARGGSIDYLAVKTGSYEKAVELASVFNPAFREAAESSTEEFIKRRRILDFFILQEDRNDESDPERLELRTNFQTWSKAVSHLAFRQGNLYLTEENSNELVYLLADAGITPPPNLQNRPSVIAPYWAFPHVLSNIVVLSGRNCSNIKSIDVFPHKYSWFGLTQKNPQARKMYIFSNYVQAMDNEKRMKVEMPEYFPTYLHVQNQHKEKGMVPDEMIFRANRNVWHTAIPVWSFMDGFDRALFHDEDGGEFTLPDLMVNLLERSGDEFSSFLDLCAGMNMDAATRSRLMSASYSMFDDSRSSRLRKTLTRRLIIKENKLSYYESADGYELESGGDIKRICNFTIMVDSVVAFSQNQDVQYQCRMIVGESIIPIELAGRFLDSANLLDGALRSKQIESEGSSNRKEDLATIHSKKDFTRVLTWIKAESANKPRERGVRYLGWGRDYKDFTTPDTIVDKSGIHTGVRYHPEKDGDHGCHKSGNLRLGIGDMPEIEPVLAELVSAIIAQVIRFYHGHSVRLIPVVNNAAGRLLGLRIFSGFGQDEIMRLSNIMPRNLDLNRGMPCLINGINRLQAGKVRMAGLWLSDKGFNFDNISERQIEHVASFLPSMIDEIAHRLITGDAMSYREKRSVDPFTALAVEGSEVIRKNFWAEWPEAGMSWSAIDKMLGERERELTVSARVDEAKDAIMLPPSLWEGLGFNRPDLVDELGRLCLTVDSTSKDLSIYGDRNSMYRLMGEFYGEVPRLAACL